MYGGDEVNAVVLDVGSYSVKGGFAGEDTPKAVFPSAIGIRAGQSGSVPAENGAAKGNGGPVKMDVDGRSREEAKRELLVGNSALSYRRDGMEVVPVLKQGLYDDWDLVQGCWEHVFNDRLRIHPEEHPVMLAEPSFIPREAREKVVELMFEHHKPPALFLAKNAVLSSFATGRQTSLVVDSGHEGTVVAAVHDGYVLQKSITRGPLGGAMLNRCMLSSVESKGAKVVPRYAFKRTEKAPGQWEVNQLDLPGTTQSYHAFAVDQIAADIKESICRVSDSAFDAEENANIPTVTYELPDGNEIQIGPDRFKVPEVLFNPSLAATFQGLDTVKNYDGGALQGIQGMVLESISKCDVDIRRDLFNGIILTGGSSLFTAVRERLEREVSEAVPQTAKVKVLSPANSMERRFSVWIGGSILASLGSFQQMWMSRAEYDEHGASLIHRKAP